MGFCPVCGEAGQSIAPRCARIARHYGYERAELDRLAGAGLSIAVPFFDVRRFFFAIDSLCSTPLARAMLDTVERDLTAAPVAEFGNAVRVLPFHHADFPEHREIYVKEDVSKTMVVYQADSSIEHFGSEERALVFAEIARQFFGLGRHVPATVAGVSPDGTKFVASAGVPRARFWSLEARPRDDLPELWRRGVLPPLALLDFVLGQNDRNAQNVLFSAGAADGAAPRGDEPDIRLIDNDDAFSNHARLPAPFAYLAGLGGAAASRPGDRLSFAGARPWFAPLRLADLVSRLAPLALPRDALEALCRRFVHARRVVDDDWSLAAFARSVFEGVAPGDDGEAGLAGDPSPGTGAWTVYRTFVEEGRHARFRTVVGEKLDDVFVVTLLAGALLSEPVAVLGEVRARSAAEAGRAVESMSVDAIASGFAHIVRRRFFVAATGETPPVGQPLRVVEVRTDPAGCHLVVKAGRLGHYETRRIERFDSFARVEPALAAADAFEVDLLAAGFVDLRARLESFKTARQPVLLW